MNTEQREEMKKRYDDVIQALVGLRDADGLWPPLLEKEKTIQGWIDHCSELIDFLSIYQQGGE